MTPVLSILVASAYVRTPMLDRLLSDLSAQASGAHAGVEIVVARDDGSEPIGLKRNRLIAGAEGGWVCFVDDDDRVAPNYVSRILDALASDPDYVGFRLQLSIDGVNQKPTFHALEYERWFEDEHGYYRDVSHLNPVRRSIAAQVAFAPHYPEDHDWSARVRPFLTRAVTIPETLYFYDWSPAGSLLHSGQCQSGGWQPIPSYPLVREI